MTRLTSVWSQQKLNSLRDEIHPNIIRTVQTNITNEISFLAGTFK